MVGNPEIPYLKGTEEINDYQTPSNTSHFAARPFSASASTLATTHYMHRIAGKGSLCLQATDLTHMLISLERGRYLFVSRCQCLAMTTPYYTQHSSNFTVSPLDIIGLLQGA